MITIQEMREAFEKRKNERHQKKLKRLNEYEEKLRRETLRKMELAEAEQRVRDEKAKIAALEAQKGPSFGQEVTAFLKDTIKEAPKVLGEIGENLEANKKAEKKHKKSKKERTGTDLGSIDLGW